MGPKPIHVFASHILFDFIPFLFLVVLVCPCCLFWSQSAQVDSCCCCSCNVGQTGSVGNAAQPLCLSFRRTLPSSLKLSCVNLKRVHTVCTLCHFVLCYSSLSLCWTLIIRNGIKAAFSLKLNRLNLVFDTLKRSHMLLWGVSVGRFIAQYVFSLCLIYK